MKTLEKLPSAPTKESAAPHDTDVWAGKQMRVVKNARLPLFCSRLNYEAIQRSCAQLAARFPIVVPK